MPTLEALRHTITSTEHLHTIVTTMKALAVVSIRQYEQAVAALATYAETIELGLQVALRNHPALLAAVRPPRADGRQARPCLIVIGSDYGMVGQFNEQIARYALSTQPDASTRATTIVIGERVAGHLAGTAAEAEHVVAVPASVAGITSLVQDVLGLVEQLHSGSSISRLVVCYNQPGTGTPSQPTHVQLVPLDVAWLHQLRARPWPSRRAPTSTLAWDELFAALIRQQLFLALYRACAASLASEHASRLAAMQGAEQNIEERLAVLTRAFHQQRQQVITEELLDIVGGFEALSSDGRDSAHHRPSTHACQATGRLV
jgi:F-type H+-transporting ATPase subunit gamma